MGRALRRPWRYPWISVGVLGTDGGHSAWYHFILSISSRGAFSFPLLSSYPSSAFVPPLRLLRSPSVPGPFSRRLLSSPLLRAPPPSASLFLGGSFIYLFFWAGGRSLSLGAPAGWLLARLDVERSLLRILALIGYTDLPRLQAECTWRVGTHLTSAGPQTWGTVPATTRPEPLSSRSPCSISGNREFLLPLLPLSPLLFPPPRP